MEFSPQIASDSRMGVGRPSEDRMEIALGSHGDQTG